MTESEKNLTVQLLSKAKELLGKKSNSYMLNDEIHICCDHNGGISEPCHWIEDDLGGMEYEKASCIAYHLQDIQKQRHALIDIVEGLEQLLR